MLWILFIIYAHISDHLYIGGRRIQNHVPYYYPPKINRKNVVEIKPLQYSWQLIVGSNTRSCKVFETKLTCLSKLCLDYLYKSHVWHQIIVENPRKCTYVRGKRKNKDKLFKKQWKNKNLETRNHESINPCLHINNFQILVGFGLDPNKLMFFQRIMDRKNMALPEEIVT